MKNRTTTTSIIIILLSLLLFSCSDNNKDGGRGMPEWWNPINVSFTDSYGNDLSIHLKTEKIPSSTSSMRVAVIDPSEYKFRFYVDDREIEQAYITKNDLLDDTAATIFMADVPGKRAIVFNISDWRYRYEQYGDRIYTIKYTFKIPKILGSEEHTIICKKTANQLGYQVFKEVLYDGKPIQLDKYEVFNIVVD